ncbi:MAG: RNA polymerase factor sigma-54, partial [Chromatiales bacterium]|nr:RNA polymerase factor sigma-54 [Chromatiales bacterium]
MKQSLQLRLGQHLAMTPQLQQAIRLLQLSTIELRTEIQDALDSNMMLEVDDDMDGLAPVPSEPPAEEDVAPVDIPSELPVDSAWEDVYDGAMGVAGNGDGNGIEYEAQRSGETSLQDHLHEQLALMRLSETDRAIATAIVDAVDDGGYLCATVPDLTQTMLSNGVEVEEDEVEACLRQVQNLDPPGVAARDLRECLLIQLRQLDSDTPWRDV